MVLLFLLVFNSRAIFGSSAGVLQRRIDYVFGLARNSRLIEALSIAIAWAEDEHQKTGKPARRYKDFRYRTRNWPRCWVT